MPSPKNPAGGSPGVVNPAVVSPGVKLDGTIAPKLLKGEKLRFPAKDLQIQNGQLMINNPKLLDQFKGLQLGPAGQIKGPGGENAIDVEITIKVSF